MAKYTVTRSCGHEETVALVGKTKDREWRLESVEPYKLCSECYQIDLQRKREEANREAAEVAKENNYPVLTGTEKQIPWAETIRQRIMADLDAIIYNKRNNKNRNELAIQEAYQAIRNKTTAHWWIDRRYIKGDFELEELMTKEYESLGVNQVAAPKNETVIDTLAESTVRPENPITETVAEIRILDDILEIRFPEKHEGFREIVKSELSMIWSDGWKRRIAIKQGSIEDRAAEAGNKCFMPVIPSGYSTLRSARRQSVQTTNQNARVGLCRAPMVNTRAGYRYHGVEMKTSIARLKQSLAPNTISQMLLSLRSTLRRCWTLQRCISSSCQTERKGLSKRLKN